MSVIHHLGKEGEDLATGYLQKKGFKITRRNYRYKSKEIDIIAELGDICVFAEIKTRSGFIHQEPEKAVNLKKQRFLIEAANYYLTRNGIDKEARFDIISIKKTDRSYKVKHLENAFSPHIS